MEVLACDEELPCYCLTIEFVVMLARYEHSLQSTSIVLLPYVCSSEASHVRQQDGCLAQGAGP